MRSVVSLWQSLSTRRWSLLAALLLGSTVQAQIYKCTAADGIPIYSDERCGPDAKIVRTIATTRRTPQVNSRTVKPELKATTELAELSRRCDAGDTEACNGWTHSGGPSLLRAEERKLEQACESGSLQACEERYCQDGATQECRTRATKNASASGPGWYLRSPGKRQRDGWSQYNVRCWRQSDLRTRDVSVLCSSAVGPSRCRGAAGDKGYANMSEAAAGSCAQSF